MRSFVLALLIFALPCTALAHGAGSFYETTVGAYIIDVGFSTPAPQEGESVIFDFQLRKLGTELTSGTDVDFTSAWVRIEGSDGTVFASGIDNAAFGGPRMSYVFPGPGTYTVNVRYDKDDAGLADASFPMTVTPASGGVFESSTFLYMLAVAGGIVLGVLAASAILLRKRRVVQ